MTERKFTDSCYNEKGDFIYPCIDCFKDDPEGQGDFWGNCYMCPACSKRYGEEWSNSAVKPGGIYICPENIEKIKKHQFESSFHPYTCVTHSDTSLILEINHDEGIYLRCPECDHSQKNLKFLIEFLDLRVKS